jgi:hypothetical protein
LWVRECPLMSEGRLLVGANRQHAAL